MKKVAAAEPDIMGFIFYSGSPRYMGNHLTPDDLKSLPPYIIRTGVFVDESCEEILRIAKLYGLNGVQLHGSESPETCKVISLAGYPVLKAFRIDDDFSFEQTDAYALSCRFFVFDAFGTGFGGNGIRFNWEKLQSYKGKTEFLLSGGIDPGDVLALKKLKHPYLAGFDINSKFEMQPGEKDVAKVKRFIAKLRS